jgi:hypothetical protein
MVFFYWVTVTDGHKRLQYIAYMKLVILSLCLIISISLAAQSVGQKKTDSVCSLITKYLNEKGYSGLGLFNCRAPGGGQSWRVGHYQPWRTAPHCTAPEPSSSLQSDQRTLKNIPVRGCFLLFSTSGKGWRPFRGLQPSRANAIT